MSQITTHILDTSLGKPAAGVQISLQESNGNEWLTIATGVTNNDGRVANLLADGKLLAPGVYRMFFETGAYYKRLEIKTFYPEVGIVFEVFDDSHYHVPLLLNPFGYSTYRGS
ncbi:hydroxyisourate hydrolase [Aureispira anguillae]|uniref:5-hydroxyisourate hydrolase n=1 Tax=Aureispira anguillae TaxID=2864201 RepID=A0A916DSV1_9BACT|nr:hydroxyisourate hydrolase [Aureispira anguillae]BDS11307.1 hydroxyisourate hydrolase [Aureispira anguillae]